ncbi:MAG: hypothetical protein CMF74_00455 [Maricaulis sp.]|nr:hypothetical protein [Maricaulis sp.]
MRNESVERPAIGQQCADLRATLTKLVGSVAPVETATPVEIALLLSQPQRVRQIIGVDEIYRGVAEMGGWAVSHIPDIGLLGPNSGPGVRKGLAIIRPA